MININKWRNRFITIFAILWCLAFHYESIRYFYLDPLVGKPLPKVKFLFPPAGWTMFYHVDQSYGHIRIFGEKGDQSFEIDPHAIFRVRTIGFDNIHRGVIGSAASQRNRYAFCDHLRKRFKGVESFRVVYTHYPNFVKEPYARQHQVVYGCTDQGAR